MITIRKMVVSSIISALGLVTVNSAVAQETGLTKDTIKIGVFGPMTGAVALYGKAVFGAEAVFKEVNDKGGIHGRKIVIVRDDDGCNPARGLAAFKKQVSQDEVFAFNAGVCSNVVMALKPEIEKSNIPFVVLGAASSKISDPIAANIFQTVATTEEAGRTLIDFAMSKSGTTKIALISHSDDWGKTNRDPVVAYMKTKYKLDPVLDLSMERSSTDATPQILRLRKSGAQFIVMLMYPAEVAIFMRDAHKFGLEIPVLAPHSISLEDTRDRVGDPAAVQNMSVYYNYAHAIGSPEMQKFSDLITKYYPSERIESFSFLGMSGAYALVKALQDSGPDLTRVKLIAALNNIKGLDTGVSSVPVTFSPNDHAGIKGGAMATFKDGHIVIAKTWQDR
jgi:branched-chain amino acid transport system substrate-binding protein